LQIKNTCSIFSEGCAAKRDGIEIAKEDQFYGVSGFINSMCIMSYTTSTPAPLPMLCYAMLKRQD